MSFLPIVERELRAAARRKSTYRIRWWTALLAIAASFCWLIFVWITIGRANVGKALFTILSGYTFALCLVAGVFLTCDSIAEEKREGTLGLLFLTDLRGYDVVLGKFIARSLNAFYALFALLPLIGLPLLAGGVTGAEFGRMTLALVNALFFSLALGICVSAFARNSENAMGLTVPLLVGLTGALPALNSLGWLTSPWSHLASLSPFYPFMYAREALYLKHPAEFGASLLASHLFAWALLAVASISLPRLWQDRSDGGLLDRGRARRSTKRPADLLAINPVLWSIGHEPAVRRLVWGIVITWGVAVFTFGSIYPSQFFWTLPGPKICGFLLKLVFATQACRFFIEARRTGALELLLCTPVRTVEIIKGQWLALRRLFLWPLVVFFLLNFVPAFFSIHQALLRPAGPQFGTAFVGLAGGLFWGVWITIDLVADLFAIGWFGMWLALTSKRPNLAPAMTIFFVVVLPSFGTFCGLDMVADLFFILWGATQLHSDLRWVLARQYQPAKSFLRPAVSRAAPPVLAR